MSESEISSRKTDLRKRLQCLEEQIEREQVKCADERKREIIKLTHEFNEIKDATQVVLGVLAHAEGVTIKEMHLRYNLPLN